MQRSLETPLGGVPKAAPWEQWEALENKNERAHFYVSWVPIFPSDPTQPVFEYLHNLRNLRMTICVQKISQQNSDPGDGQPFKPTRLVMAVSSEML
jgi:hypothetical protein